MWIPQSVTDEKNGKRWSQIRVSFCQQEKKRSFDALWYFLLILTESVTKILEVFLSVGWSPSPPYTEVPQFWKSYIAEHTTSHRKPAENFHSWHWWELKVECVVLQSVPQSRIVTTAESPANICVLPL